MVLHADIVDASLEQFVLDDAMVLGRKTYQGLAWWVRWSREEGDARFVVADRLHAVSWLGWSPGGWRWPSSRGWLAWGRTTWTRG